MFLLSCNNIQYIGVYIICVCSVIFYCKTWFKMKNLCQIRYQNMSQNYSHSVSLARPNQNDRNWIAWSSIFCNVFWSLFLVDQNLENPKTELNSSVRHPPLQSQYECNLLPTYRAPPVTLLVQQYVFFSKMYRRCINFWSCHLCPSTLKLYFWVH